MDSIFESLESAAKEYGLDLSEATPEEVMSIINNKDAYRVGIWDDIFDEIAGMRDESYKKKSTVEIFFGPEGGGPKETLEQIIYQIQKSSLNELVGNAIISYEIEQRDTGEGNFYYAWIIKYVPENYLNWYGEQRFGQRQLGLANIFSLAKALGDVKPAVFYLQICDWWEKAKMPEQGIAKSISEITQATSLTLDEQKPIRKLLIDRGLLHTSRPAKGNSPTYYKPLKWLAFMHGNSTDEKTENEPVFEERQKVLAWFVELIAINEAIKDSPEMKGLQKHTNKRTGKLSEVTGEKGHGKYKQRGDQIVSTKGFERHGDLNTTEKHFDEFQAMKKRRAELRELIKEYFQKKRHY